MKKYKALQTGNRATAEPLYMPCYMYQHTHTHTSDEETAALNLAALRSLSAQRKGKPNSRYGVL